jgi:RimJ/RimL family protein N-acetyltransferase
MTVSLRPYRPEDDDDRFRAEGMLRRYFDGEGDLGDLVMHAMTRDDWEDARKAWNSTG